MSEKPERSEPTREDFYSRVTTTDPEVLESAHRPGLQDVIRIDGHWAQVGPSQDTINFLADSSRTVHKIDWNAYQLKRLYNGVNVATYRRFEPDAITEDEFSAIYWGDGQTDPSFKGRVKLFGEYEKKENIT